MADDYDDENDDDSSFYPDADPDDDDAILAGFDHDQHGQIPGVDQDNEEIETMTLLKRSLKLGHVSTSTCPSATALPGS
jgi:hypothetical protein